MFTTVPAFGRFGRVFPSALPGLAKPCRGIALRLLLLGPLALATAPRAAAQPPQAHRILVKIKPALAGSLETEWLRRPAGIEPGTAQTEPSQGFLHRYSLKRMLPVFPGIIRLRHSQGWSDAQFAQILRQKFSPRAARMATPKAVPEVSRTYAVEPADTSAKGLGRLLRQLQADPQVEYAEVDRIVSVDLANAPATASLPDDPFLSSSGTWAQSYADLWGMNTIHAPAAWNSNNGAGVVVAVIDTGIDYNHPDLAGNLWTNRRELAGNGLDDDGNGYADDVHGWDFIGASASQPVEGNDPMDHFGHGTHVAGTIAAVGNNGLGVIGVAWGAKVMAVKGLDDYGNGLLSTLSAAILYAAKNGADVINASWSGQGNPCPQVLEEAIQFATNLGVVFVAAAGNNREDASNYFPANSPEAITVAASSPWDSATSFSNFGSRIDAAAPGQDILSLRAAGTSMGRPVNADYTCADGTSMAAPHVAGVAALILAQHPGLAVEDLRQRLRTSASQGSAAWDGTLGFGVINAQGALALTSVLQTHILSPVAGSFLAGPTPVLGIANGAGFQRYVLEFGAGQNPQAWTVLATSSTPVAGGQLGSFDPSGVADGVYTLRLTAWDGSTQSFSDRLEITVAYLAITSPVRPLEPTTAQQFKPGAQIAITGSAIGPSFQAFRLQWAKGIQPSGSWSDSGIQLAGAGMATVAKGWLGSWDTTAISEAGYYTLALLVDNAGFTSRSETLVYLEPDLLSEHWPQALTLTPLGINGFAPVLDGSGHGLLALGLSAHDFAASAGELLLTKPDGTGQSHISLAFGTNFYPAIGAITGSSRQGVFISNAPDDVSLVLPGGTGPTVVGRSANAEDVFCDEQIVLEDIEGLGEQNIAILANRNGRGQASLFAFRQDGSLLNANFPLAIVDNNPHLFNTVPRVLVGDLNGDGAMQFVVLTGPSDSSYSLARFTRDGAALPWPVPILNEGSPLALSLADLDHNGKLETLLLNSRGILHVFQPDGSERAGWPKALQVQGVNLGYACAMAVGDLDGLGQPQIVVLADPYVFVLSASGSSHSPDWPRKFGDYFTSASHICLADIDGDGFPEILTTTGSTLPAPTCQAAGAPGAPPARPFRSGAYQSGFYQNFLVALRRDGTLVKSWPLLGVDGKVPAPSATIAVGDFDHNGLTEIALSYPVSSRETGWESGGVASVLTTGAPFNPVANDWPMMNHDPQNSSVYHGSNTTHLMVAITAPASGAVVAGLTTLTASASDDQGITEVQFQLDGTNLAAAITQAPFTTSFDFAPIAPGSHVLRALAKSRSGRAAISAPSNVIIPRKPSSTSLALTSGASPCPYGTALAWLATVTPASATGTLVFLDGANPVSGNLPLVHGTAAFSSAALGAGSHAITAQFTGDSETLGSMSAPVNLTVSAVASSVDLGLAPNAPSCSLGASLTWVARISPATATGSVNFLEGAMPVSTSLPVLAGSATFTSSTLPIGKHDITAQYSGDDNHLGCHSAAVTVTVNPVIIQSSSSTTLTLTAGYPSWGAGNPVTLEASVSPASATGNLQLFDGATAMASLPLTQGKATFTCPGLQGGDHGFTAHYSGDANLFGSISPALGLTIAEFSLRVEGPAGPVQAGGRTQIIVTVTPIDGFNGPVSLSCSGLAAHGQASFSPASLALNGAPLTSVLTLNMAVPVARFRQPGEPGWRSSYAYPMGGGLLGLVWLTGGTGRAGRGRKRQKRLALLVLLASMGLFQCGGGGSGSPQAAPPAPSPRPAETLQLTINAQCGQLGHFVQVPVTITY